MFFPQTCHCLLEVTPRFSSGLSVGEGLVHVLVFRGNCCTCTFEVHTWRPSGLKTAHEQIVN